MRTPILVLLALGCSESHDLEARRARQAELEATVEVLAADLEAMSADFEAVTGADAVRKPDPSAAPVRKSGGRPVGHQTPRRVLGEQLRVVVERTGTVTALPSLDAPTKAAGPCGWSFDLPRLRPISDLVLRNAGMGRASPILLLEDDEPLSPHAEPADIGERCAGAFRHAGAAVQFSPSGRSNAAKERRYRLTYAEQTPFPRGDDGRPLYWIHPGTQLEFQLIDRWDPAWGDPTLTLAVKLIGEHGARPLVEMGQVTAQLEGDTPLIEQAVPHLQLDGSWALRIASPADGPWIVLDTLTIGNGENAVVITGERAWEAR
ncbi:MAG: hypothetical protein ACI8PZ_000294 [Myxococcota bacterium]